MAQLSAQQHRASATIPASKAYPQGRFPTPDLAHARLALQDLPKAKNLPAGQAAQIKARATRMLAAAKAAK